MDDRRCELRARRVKNGAIQFNNKSSTMSCQMRDLSSKGARLKFVNTLGTPDEFKMDFPGAADNRWARRAWVRYDEMGVEFL